MLDIETTDIPSMSHKRLYDLLLSIKLDVMKNGTKEEVRDYTETLFKAKLGDEKEGIQFPIHYIWLEDTETFLIRPASNLIHIAGYGSYTFIEVMDELDRRQSLMANYLINYFSIEKGDVNR